MTLTDRLGIVVNCFPGRPDQEALKFADGMLVEYVSQMFPDKIKLLDIGCGQKGSAFINEYTQRHSAEATYLDNDKFGLRKLKKPRKVHADAVKMPFTDDSFDIAYAGYVIASGILKDHFHTKDDSYRLAKEAHRVIRPEGLFMFTYVTGDDRQTLDNLEEIGFREVKHLLRTLWMRGIPTDTYAARK